MIFFPVFYCSIVPIHVPHTFGCRGFERESESAVGSKVTIITEPDGGHGS